VTHKRKLIEVALPLEAISAASAHEKSVPRRGHPATMHLWWARRPLAACRAVLFASLVDDPSMHPDRFPTEQAQQQERQRLFSLIEALVRWENTSNPDLLKAAQAEILASCDGNPPPVLDPFCGGGSIPLEAQRLGLEAHASDLNPVAVLITKALIELPPRFAGRPPVHPEDGSAKALGSWEGARGLAEDVSYYGGWMRREAERRISHLYPKVTLPPEHGGGEATVIAWIWARTVKSPNPAWDGPMPLVRSLALSTKKGKETWVQPVIDRDHRQVRYEIRTGPGCPEGTVGRNGAVCLATSTPVPLGYIRAEGKAGRMGAQLMAIVAEGSHGRIYFSYPVIFSTVVAPKSQELVADPHRFRGDRNKAKHHFETGLRRTFHLMGETQHPEYPLTIVYGFKQAESRPGEAGLAPTGWETILDALLSANISINGTWPLRSERLGRLRDVGSNALASSIILVCRPKPAKAPLATRKEFLAALKAELPLAFRRLQQGNIAPVDLAQAAIGPGISVFSRYAKVIEADGQPMSVRTALGLINQMLDETLAEQQADFDSETRWALAWFEQHGMNPGPFGIAETLSKAKNTAVNGLVAAGIVTSKAGKVRLLDRDELPVVWNPATDRRLTVWEVTQHLIRSLDTGGEAKAAGLLQQVGGGLGETARELAYRLSTLCERKKWQKEALAYNALVVSWPEIVRLAVEVPKGSGQQTLV
jgi:adenine-specific DNA methylase